MEPYNKSTPMSIRMYKTEGNQGVPLTTTYTKTSWTNTFNGVKYPGWRSAVERFVGATTIASAQSTKIDHSDGSMFVGFYLNNSGRPQDYREVTEKGWLYQGGGHVPQGLLPNEAAASDAAGKFYSRARNELHAIQGGELIGEMGKTAQSVVKVTKAMVDGLVNWRRNIRRIKNAGPRRWAASASDAYLEWKFGWDPLAKDVRHLMKDFENDYFESTNISASGTETFDTSSYTYSESLSIAHYDVTVRNKHVSTVRYIGALSLERAGGGSFAERLGLSPNNFIPTLYNLLPWTYMIDYFTNLGNFVNAVGFPHSRIRWCNRTIRNSYVTEVLAGSNLKANVNPGTKVNYIAVPQSTTWTSTGFYRDSAKPPQMPTEFRFKVPSTWTELGRRQWGNVAAVIANRTWSRNGNLAW